MRPINHPDFVYQPWSAERKAAASRRQKERIAASRIIIEITDYLDNPKECPDSEGSPVRAARAFLMQYYGMDQNGYSLKRKP